MRRTLALLMALLLFLTPSLMAYSLESSSTASGEYKDLIFVIDRSMYTSSQDLDRVKRSIIEYSDAFLKTGELNQFVSIVEYSTWANLLVSRTTDIEEVRASLDRVYPLGFSNVTDAVDMVNSIHTGDKKYVVMFNNFYPNVGPLEKDGNYQLKDHLYFRNANALKSRLDRLREDAVVFNISNLRGLKNTKDYHFASRLYLENTDYNYEVSSGEDFDKAFLDVTVKINSDIGNSNEEVFKRPIVFVPGVSGSELFYVDEAEVSEFEESIGSIWRENDKDAKRIWLPIGVDRNEINKYIDANTRLYGLQQGNLRDVPLIERHYGPMALYMPLLNKLMDVFPDREVYLFSYDWRQTNERSAEQLANFISHVTDMGRTKVDLLAHSMGGIISSLYLENNDHMVDKYVSFGTPYDGASKSFNQFASGNVLGGVMDFMLKDVFGIDLKLPNAYASIVELFPTKLLLERYPYQLVKDGARFEEILNDKSNYVNEMKIGTLEYEKVVDKTLEQGISASMNYEEISNVMREKLGLERYDSFIDVLGKFRENADFSRNVNVLNRDKALFFVGTGIPTEVSAYLSLNDQGYKVEQVLVSKKGDSLVPLFSATMGMELDQMPVHLRDKFVLRNNDHLFLLSDPYNLRVLVEFLSDR